MFVLFLLVFFFFFFFFFGGGGYVCMLVFSLGVVVNNSMHIMQNYSY